MATRKEFEETNRAVNWTLVAAICFLSMIFVTLVCDDRERKDLTDFAYECGKASGQLVDRSVCVFATTTIRFKDRDSARWPNE